MAVAIRTQYKPSLFYFHWVHLCNIQDIREPYDKNESHFKILKYEYYTYNKHHIFCLEMIPKLWFYLTYWQSYEWVCVHS